MVTTKTILADLAAILIGGIIGITLATLWATRQVYHQTTK